MSGHNIHYVRVDTPRTEPLQKMLCNDIPTKGAWKGEDIVDVSWDTDRSSYAVMTKCIEEDKELAGTYYERNGDVVEATRTGDVFLFLGGMYYNLTSGGNEMRGRKSIRREDGPLKKLSNIANSGNLFKEAIREVAYKGVDLHVEEMPF